MLGSGVLRRYGLAGENVLLWVTIALRFQWPKLGPVSFFLIECGFLHVAFATLPKLQEQTTLPAPTQLPLNPQINDTHTEMFIFNLPSWCNCWALLNSQG